MITGTVRNAVQLQTLTNKWEQKKKSGNVLSKDERNERANWTQEQRMINDYQEQLEKEKEASKKQAIANKISGGQTLTPEEEKYLATYDPQGLADYKQTKSERKAYEEKLKNCKTKDEVQRLKTTTLGKELASLKKVINDPYIPISEKLKKAQQTLGKTNNIQQAEEEFIESGKYDDLPTNCELAIEQAKENNITEHEINDSVQEEDNKDKVAENEENKETKEIKEICKRYISDLDRKEKNKNIKTEHKITKKKTGDNIDIIL